MTRMELAAYAALQRLARAYRELEDLPASASAPFTDDIHEAAEVLENVVDAIRAGKPRTSLVLIAAATA